MNINKTYYLVFRGARMKVDYDASIQMNNSLINNATH